MKVFEWMVRDSLLILIYYILATIFIFALYIGAALVAVHFIIKYW